MKVFVSHSHTDAPLAARVCEGLRREGLEARHPDLHHLPGDNWAANVGRALEESEAMVVLLTPAAVDSRHVMREIEYALGARNYSNSARIGCQPVCASSHRLSSRRSD